MSRTLKVVLFVIGVFIIVGIIITMVLCSNVNLNESDSTAKAADKDKIEEYLKISIPKNAKVLNYYYNDDYMNNDFLETRIRVNEEDYNMLVKSMKLDYMHSDLETGRYMYDGSGGVDWWDSLANQNQNKELYDYYYGLGPPVRNTGIKTAYRSLYVFKEGNKYDMYFRYAG